MKILFELRLRWLLRAHKERYVPNGMKLLSRARMRDSLFCEMELVEEKLKGSNDKWLSEKMGEIVERVTEKLLDYL